MSRSLAETAVAIEGQFAQQLSHYLGQIPFPALLLTAMAVVTIVCRNGVPCQMAKHTTVKRANPVLAPFILFSTVDDLVAKEVC